MNTTTSLTIEVRSAGGTFIDFHQCDEQSIQEKLRFLASPRLLTQPELTLPWEGRVSSIPTQAIDMILARSSVGAPAVFPLIFPAGLLDLVEVTGESLQEDSTTVGDGQDTACAAASPITAHIEIHTVGGWVSHLKALAMVPANACGERRSFASVCKLPALVFRLSGGGIGLINPSNITQIKANPALKMLTKTAPCIHLEPVRWNFRRAGARRFNRQAYKSERDDFNSLPVETVNLD